MVFIIPLSSHSTGSPTQTLNYSIYVNPDSYVELLVLVGALQVEFFASIVRNDLQPWGT